MVWGLIILLSLCVIPPALFILNISLHDTLPDGSFGPLTFRYYRDLWGDSAFISSLKHTLLYALGSSFIALVIGTTQALIVERTNAPGRHYAFLGAIISLGVPHVLYVVSWLLVLGNSGPINHLLIALGFGEGINVYSMWGMIFIEGVGFVPLTFLLMSAVFRNADAALEEAALMAGSRPLRAFWRVTLQMSFPAICALMLLIFIKAFESFEVPALVGLSGNIDILTTMIYQTAHKTGIANYSVSGAYSVCLVVIVSGLLFWQSRMSRHAHRYQTITGKGFRPRVIDLGRWRVGASFCLYFLFFIVTIVPVLVLFFTSLQPFYEGVTLDAFSRLTWQNYVMLLDQDALQDTVVNTLLLGFGTACCVVPLTALCSWLVVRHKSGAVWLELIAGMPLVFPALILSVAFLNLFINLPISLYGTLLSLVIASSVRFLPYGMRYSFAGVMQIHTDLEEAASMSGASRWRVFRHIIAPLLIAALLSSWLLIFLLSVQSVSLPLLLVGPGTQVMATTLFELWQNGQVTELASMGMIWIALMTGVSICVHRLTRKQRLAL